MNRTKFETRIDDLTPFQITTIEVDGKVINVSPPLNVQPEIFECEEKRPFPKRYLLFSDDELNLHVASSTRAELYEAIVSDLGFSYREYVLASDGNLSPAALEYKNLLSQRLQVKQPRLSKESENNQNGMTT